MTDIARALTELGIKEWVLRGEPTSKTEFSTMYAKVTGADASGSAIESQKESDWGTTWEAVVAKRDELIAEEPMNLLRAERNAKLAETDWTQSRDITLSNDDAWKEYRQLLRDFPSVVDINNIVWPTKPE